MRLTQKELEIVKNFVKGVGLILPYQKEVIDYVQNYKNFLSSTSNNRLRLAGLLKGQLGNAFFEPLSDEELKLWNCENESPEIIEAFNKSVTNMPKAKKNESIYTDEELEEF